MEEGRRIRMAKSKDEIERQQSGKSGRKMMRTKTKREQKRIGLRIEDGASGEKMKLRRKAEKSGEERSTKMKADLAAKKRARDDRAGGESPYEANDEPKSRK